MRGKSASRSKACSDLVLKWFDRMNRCVGVARVARIRMLATVYLTGRYCRQLISIPHLKVYGETATIQSIPRIATVSNESSNPLGPAHIPRADFEAGGISLSCKHLMLPHPASNDTVARAKLVPPQTLLESSFPSMSLPTCLEPTKTIRL